MATTTNYGWSTPDDSAYVKDGASAIRTLGSAVDSTLKTQVDNLTAANIPNSIVDAKGDLIVATGADAVTRLPVGSTNQILTADSTAATGVKWSSPAGAATYANITGANLTYTITGATFVSGTSITFTTSATHSLVVGMQVTVGGVVATYTTANPNANYTITAVTGTTFTAASTITALTYTSGGSVAPRMRGNIRFTKYINGYWVVQDAYGYIHSSTDGITWNTGYNATSVAIDIAYNGTNYVIISRSATLNGAYATSLTSVAWTQLNASIGSIATLNRIIWVGGSINLFVAVGGSISGSGVGYIYTSPTGVTWTSRANTANAGIVDVDFDGTTLCAVHKGYSATPVYYGGTSTSTNATSWTSTNMSTGGTANSNCAFSMINYNPSLSRWMLWNGTTQIYLITTANLATAPTLGSATVFPQDATTTWYSIDSTYNNSSVPLPSGKFPRIYHAGTNTFASAQNGYSGTGLVTDVRYSGLVSTNAGKYVAPIVSVNTLWSGVATTVEGTYAYNGSSLLYVLADSGDDGYGIRVMVK
jgi:hypothetical protein